ncbi:hypothetical protein [Streptomyces scabiei]|uniref:Uncharacterized protein n=1 Tax=Streptomyces scabiei TaxID=1930 RepID=A0A100JLU8_STRSC|nr:hypothetical protein [Streptomyces scabiei]GAQ61922.1 hypothetical protein SsS58_02276 [Streptomyces scabiei]
MRRPIVRRTDPRLEIIRETIERLIPGSTPAFLGVQVTEKNPNRTAVNTWSGDPAGLAEKVFTALYGRPRTEAVTSPLAQAEAAKRGRDLVAEVDSLTSAHDRLTGAPWYPARPGDTVHVHYEQAGNTSAFGETYIVGDASETGDTPPGLMSLILLAHTLPASTPEDHVKGMTGCFEAEAADDPIYQAWFEAGPHRLTIVRDGRVVHNGGGR